MLKIKNKPIIIIFFLIFIFSIINIDAYASENDSSIKLNDGNFENWIDRIDIPEYGYSFYDKLVEYTNNDGINDYLIIDDGYSKNTAKTIYYGEDYGSDTFNGIEVLSINNINNVEKQYIYNVIQAVYDSFLMDHPEVFWLSGYAKSYCVKRNNNYTFYFIIKMHEGSTSSEFDIRSEKYIKESIIDNIKLRDSAINEILNSNEILESKNNYEILYNINKYLTHHNEYNKKITSNDNIYNYDCHNCLSALLSKTEKDAPFCDGYAKAFKILCNKKGIPCTLSIGISYSNITNSSGTHEWNLVKLNNKWYAIDVTWNDPVAETNSGFVSGLENEKYFLIGNNTINNNISFSDSHKMHNKISKNGTYFINEPKISEVEYNIMNNNIYRIYGSNRYKTSLIIADELKAKLSLEKFSTIIISSGKNFPDALSGSYLAAQKNAPILMYDEKNIKDIENYMQKNLADNGMIYILGGTSVISEYAEETFKNYGNVKRLSGVDRYKTNIAILNEIQINDEDILVCTGKDFADSLSVSATGKPILLVKDELTNDQIEFLNNHNIKSIYIIGGSAAINNKIEEDLKEYTTVFRVCGKNRYETSTLCAELFFSNQQAAVFAYAKNFPDGLCGGSLAYSLNIPLILISNDDTDYASLYIKKQKINYGILIGGENLISNYSVYKLWEN